MNESEKEKEKKNRRIVWLRSCWRMNWNDMAVCVCVCGLLVESLLLGDGFDSKGRNDSRLFRVFRMVSQKEERKPQVNVCMSECLSSHQSWP